MRQFAYAKPVDGGFQIASYVEDPYFVTVLPKRCERSNLPILVVPENVDRIIRIHERANKTVDLLRSAISNVLKNFCDSSLELRDRLREDKNNTGLQEEVLSDDLAAACIGPALEHDLQPWIQSNDAWTANVSRNLEERNAQTAREAGFQVNIMDNRDRANHLHQFLLSVFNMGFNDWGEWLRNMTTDCGNKDCLIHGESGTIKSPPTASNQATPEKDRKRETATA